MLKYLIQTKWNFYMKHMGVVIKAEHFEIYNIRKLHIIPFHESLHCGSNGANA